MLNEIHAHTVEIDAVETVMLTHGNYFDAVPSASPDLAGV